MCLKLYNKLTDTDVEIPQLTTQNWHIVMEVGTIRNVLYWTIREKLLYSNKSITQAIFCTSERTFCAIA